MAVWLKICFAFINKIRLEILMRVCDRVCAENQALRKALDEKMEQFLELRRENTCKCRETTKQMLS